MLRNFFLVAFVFILLSSFAFGIGISHPLETAKIEFEPNKEINYNFGILDAVGEDVEINVGGDAEFSSYISLGELQGKKEDSLRAFSVKIKFPESFKIPGWHIAYISAKIKAPSEGVVTIATTISTPLKVYVPFNGKYIDAKLTSSNININEPVNFTLNVESMGTEVVDRVYADLEIFDAYNNSLGKVKTTTINGLKSRESKSAYASFKSDKLIRGDYFVNGIVYYDNNKTYVSSRFKVGTFFVNISGMNKEIVFSGIQPFDVFVENLWNGDIGDVYAVVDVNGNKYKTSSTSLTPFKQDKITAFVDTEKLKLGENYTFKSVVYYGSESSSYESLVQVVEKKIVAEKKKDYGNLWIYGLGGLAVLLILANVYFFFVLNRLRRQ